MFVTSWASEQGRKERGELPDEDEKNAWKRKQERDKKRKRPTSPSCKSDSGSSPLLVVVSR